MDSLTEWYACTFMYINYLGTIPECRGVCICLYVCVCCVVCVCVCTMYVCECVCVCVCVYM